MQSNELPKARRRFSSLEEIPSDVYQGSPRDSAKVIIGLALNEIRGADRSMCTTLQIILETALRDVAYLLQFDQVPKVEVYQGTIL